MIPGGTSRLFEKELMNMTLNSTERFSDRVRDYVKYRPGYPQDVIAFMKRELGLTSSQIIVDLGSGTGIFSKLLLENGNTVFGVEPNEAMRAMAEQLLNSYSKFKSIAGSSEDTKLVDKSVDMLTAAQAFHWFDPEKTRKEGLRILKPNSFAVILWNERKQDATPFLNDYEKLLLKFGTDYEQVKRNDERQPQALEIFFAGKNFKKFICPNYQVLDLDGLKGRILSASYVPKAGTSGYEPMIKEIERVFRHHNNHGKVRLEYDTGVYYGILT